MGQISGIVGNAIQGVAAIGGAIARRRQMRKAMKEIDKSAKEQKSNIEAAEAKERKIENEDGMQLASTQKMLAAIDERMAARRAQNRNLAAMGMIDEGTAAQLSQGNDTAELAGQALLNQQNRKDAAVKSQEALMGQKNAVVNSRAQSIASLHQANAEAAAKAAESIGSQINNTVSKFNK